MKVDCPHCAAPSNLDDRSAGRTIRCAACGKSFVAPQELAVVGRQHTLHYFPVATVLLLHFVTAGVFSLIYLNLLHERMPKLRKSDPSATVAIGLSFVPGINLFWLFFSYRRLCERINEQLELQGLHPTAPEWLVIPLCVLLICGAAASFVSVAGWYALGVVGVLVMPLFAALVQNAVNGLCEQAGQTSHTPALS